MAIFGDQNLVVFKRFGDSAVGREFFSTIMKTLKLLALSLVLAGAASAQSTGFFVTAGGGLGIMSVDEFTVYNPEGGTGSALYEPLKTKGRKASVKVARLNVGYNFTENWALQVGYAGYGTGEVTVAVPTYPDVDWTQLIGSGPSVYSRHVVKFKTTALTLMPTFTAAVDEKARIIVGAGIISSKTESHFEATYTSGAVVATPPQAQSYSYASESNRNVGLAFMLGYDRLVYKTVSIGLVGNYATMKMKVPSAPWPKRSDEEANVSAASIELYVGWHW